MSVVELELGLATQAGIAVAVNMGWFVESISTRRHVRHAHRCRLLSQVQIF